MWTRLIVHGLDSSDAAEPRLVYGFLDRSADGIKPSDDWDVMGMRPSHSRATILDDVRMEPERVARRIEPGPVPDLLTFAITSNFQLLIASVYAGVAQRALELGAEALKKRKSAKRGVSYAEVPETRVRLADAHMDYLAVPAQLDSYTRDFDELADHGAGWPLRLVSARINASQRGAAGPRRPHSCAPVEADSATGTRSAACSGMRLPGSSTRPARTRPGRCTRQRCWMSEVAGQVSGGVRPAPDVTWVT